MPAITKAGGKAINDKQSLPGVGQLIYVADPGWHRVRIEAAQCSRNPYGTLRYSPSISGAIRSRQVNLCVPAVGGDAGKSLPLGPLASERFGTGLRLFPFCERFHSLDEVLPCLRRSKSWRA